MSRGTSLIANILPKMFKNQITAKVWCVSIIIQVLAHNKAHTKLGESHTDMCVCFASQKW